jgi:orotate phosphoribosyltransferase
MENKSFRITLAGDPKIYMNVTPGHFTTSNNHLSHYIDLSEMKTNVLVAEDVAKKLAEAYPHGTPIDTVVCMEGTEIIGAYLAEELLRNGIAASNSGDIHVLTPISTQYMNLVFAGSSVDWIRDKYILLLVASINGGRTVKSALECLAYYGGIVSKTAALFLASGDEQWGGVNALFTADDITGYTLASPGECKLCNAGLKLDAIVSSAGYTII